jgi:phage terminase small subunit
MSKRKPRKLTNKQQAFISEYAIDKNGKQACIRAGYAPKNAEITASKLLRLAKVRDLVNEKLAKQNKKAELTADAVNEVLAGMIMTDACDLYEEGPDGTMIPKSKDDLTSRQKASVQEISTIISAEGAGYTKIKQYDRLKAIDIYYKKTGVYSDNGGVTNIGTIHINVLNQRRERAGMDPIPE